MPIADAYGGIVFDIDGVLIRGDAALPGAAETLGGLGTTVVHPATTSHRSIDPETRRELEISEGLLRFSIGIEDPEDLIREVLSALDHSKT
jgi:cystathionine beta-lyase/cystathionine gamma-synthase